MNEGTGNGHDALSIIKEASEIQQLIVDMLSARYQSYFGHPMDYLIKNSCVVRAFADHPDSEYRSLALSFLAKHGGSAEWVKALLMRKARDDPSESVRRCAISDLAMLKHGVEELHILYFLKNIVYDECEDTSVRKAAYFGITYFDRYDNLMDRETFNFPEQVDWEHLEHLLPGDRNEGVR